MRTATQHPGSLRTAVGTTAVRAGALTAVVLAAVACSPGGGGPAAAPAASAFATGTATAARPPVAAPCRTAALRAALARPDVGAGQYRVRVVFTNVSGRACTLTGYPGVWYVGAHGLRSGNRARRAGGGRPVTTVTLAPRGTAYAVLHDANGPGGYSLAQCRLTAAEGLRVVPPGQRTALFVPWRTRHCAGRGVTALTIGPVGR